MNKSLPGLNNSLLALCLSAGIICPPPAGAVEIPAQQAAVTDSTIRAGRHALNHQAYQRAQSFFERELAHNPFSLNAKIGLAQSLYGLGKQDEALKVVDDANNELAQLKGNIDADTRLSLHLTRAKILHELKRYGEAADELSGALQQTPCAEGYSNRATAFDAMGKTDLAMSDLNKTVEMDPRNASVLLRRALLRRHLGDTAGAKSDLDSAVKLDPALITWRASFSKDQGDNHAAIEDYSQAIDTMHGGDKATQLFNRGIIYEGLDEHRKAIADFSDAIGLKADYAPYFAHRGTSYYGVSDFKHAILDFTNALQLDATNPDYFFRRGNAYVVDQRPQLAMADFDQAVKLDGGKHAEYFVKRAELKSELGQHDGAIEDITRAIELTKSQPDYFLDRGLEYEAAGQPAKSEEDLSVFLQSHPDDAGALKARGIDRLATGHKEQALADLHHAECLYEQEGDRHGLAEIKRLLQSAEHPLPIK